MKTSIKERVDALWRLDCKNMIMIMINGIM